MDKNLAMVTKNMIKVYVDAEEFMIDAKHMEKTTNRAGIKLWKYRYWLIETRDRDCKIIDPDEFHRFLKAITNPAVRFVQVAENMFVNITEIRTFGERVGYCARGGEDAAH